MNEKQIVWRRSRETRSLKVKEQGSGPSLIKYFKDKLTNRPLRKDIEKERERER